MIVLKLIAGFILLIGGADLLVKGASKIAAAMGISPLVIGLTVVALGTSSPELAVSILSSINGTPNIALGNVIGSNIFNVLFILGISSLIIPLVVAQQLVRFDVPIMIGASLLTLCFAWDKHIQAWEGLVMVFLGIAYTIFIIYQSKKEKNKEVLLEYQEEFGEPVKPKTDKPWISLLLIVIGLGLLVLGSQWLVDSAVLIANNLGVSDLVVSLTIIAAGTSLPEVATSIIASVKGERDIAVGNVVGSNIFNLLIILGLSAAVSGGIPVQEATIAFDIPVMTAVAVACLPILFTGHKIERWEGALFFGYYLAYTIYIILASVRSQSLENFSIAMIWFVIPITLLTLGVVVIREIKAK